MDKRDAILKAALDLFAERGYYGASVAQIAEKAQVGTGTIYRYFKDKDVLVNELYRLWKKKMSEALLTDLPEEMPPRQLFHVIWDRLKKFSRENLNVVKFLEFHHHAPYLDEESQRTCEELKMELHEFFELCRRGPDHQGSAVEASDGHPDRRFYRPGKNVLRRGTGTDARKRRPGGRNLLGNNPPLNGPFGYRNM